MKEFNGKCKLEGVAAIMFDRYPGDNNTKLPTRERAYLNAEGQLVIPVLNIFSMLSAENTKSVSKQFGKAAKSVAGDVNAGLSIPGTDIPLTVDGAPVVMPAELTYNHLQPVYARRDVARVKGGIPNPKERPVVNTPWALEFEFAYLEGTYCTIVTLRDMFERAGRFVGLGTFRPLFGQFRVAEWQI